MRMSRTVGGALLAAMLLVSMVGGCGPRPEPTPGEGAAPTSPYPGNQAPGPAGGNNAPGGSGG